MRRLLPLVLLTGCNGCTVEDPLPPTVIVLVLDGVRTDEFSTATASDLTGVPGEEYADETWRTLVGEGTVQRAALNPGITITAPAHAAMVIGREEPFANFPVDTALGAGLYIPELPTIFEEARAQLDLEEDEVVFLANTELLLPLQSSLFPGYAGGARYDLLIDEKKDAPVNDDEPVMEALLELLDSRPRLVVVNLHDVDRAGHYGDGDAYIDDVDKIDGLLADFWQAVERDHPALRENLLLVVTADHGRHRHDEHDGWHNHGDTCTGCREVPLLVLGPAKAGEERDDTVVNIDLAPTIAAHLGFDLPWAEGLPWVEAFDGLDGAARSGEVEVSASGSHVAAQAWRDDRDARSEVLVDGEVLSTPGTYAAEAPVLVDATDGARVCFRELDLATGEDTLPWRPRCLAEADGAWSEMGFPDEEVGPFFEVAFVERDGQLWVAWPNNPHGSSDIGVDGGIGLAISSWSPTGGWTDRLWARAIFPTDVAVAATDRGLVTAVGTSLGDPDYRYSRRIRVVPVDLSGEPYADEATDITLEGLLGEGGRPERPALRAEGDHVWLAALGHGEVEGGVASIVATVESTDGGLSWGAPAAMPDAGPPFPHLTPAWDGPLLVWAVAPDALDGEALLCRAAPGDAEADCVGVGSARVDSFSVQDGVATVSRDAGVGAWERVVVAW